MAVLQAILISALLSFGYLGIRAENDIDGVSIRDLSWKFDMLMNESFRTMEAVQNIVLDTPASRLQLTSMVASYLMELNYGLNALNTAVPNVFEKEGYDVALNATAALHIYITDLQEDINKSPEVLKNTLVTLLKTVKPSLVPLKKDVRFPNQIINNGYDFALDLLIYGMVKVRLQAEHFRATNEEIAAEFKNRIGEITQVAAPSVSNDKKALIELRHRVMLLQVITERVTNRMQNLIELNSNNAKIVSIAEGVIETMGDLFKRETLAVMKLRTVAELKAELLSIYVTGTVTVIKLAEIQFSEYSGGQEYIRSTLLDGMTIGAVFSENLRKMPYQA